MTAPRTYTPEEVVAQFLPSTTPGGLRKQAQRRQIRHRRIGGQIVFTDDDIQHLVEGAACEPVTEAPAPRVTPPRRRAAPNGGGGETPAAPVSARPGGPRRLQSS